MQKLSEQWEWTEMVKMHLLFSGKEKRINKVIKSIPLIKRRRTEVHYLIYIQLIGAGFLMICIFCYLGNFVCLNFSPLYLSRSVSTSALV